MYYLLPMRQATTRQGGRVGHSSSSDFTILDQWKNNSGVNDDY